MTTRIPRTEDPREIQGWRRSQKDTTGDKANKVVGGTEDNIVTLKSDGDIQDSGVGIDDIALKTGTTRRAYFYGRHF